MWNTCVKIYRKYEEIINYLIAGVLTTLVSLAAYYGCVLTVLDPLDGVQLQAANVISWILAVAFAYGINRGFVFKSKSKNRLSEALRFVGSRVTTLFMDMAVMYVFVTLLKGNDKIGKLFSQVVVMAGNYLLSKLFVFRKRKDGE
ncbi:MAG: GtrA family protein [Lachnospiraceae bacterium]|nr:GtrA family protein [Lachnospiraceae bacterium]